MNIRPIDLLVTVPNNLAVGKSQAQISHREDVNQQNIATGLAEKGELKSKQIETTENTDVSKNKINSDSKSGAGYQSSKKKKDQEEEQKSEVEENRKGKDPLRGVRLDISL